MNDWETGGVDVWVFEILGGWKVDVESLPVEVGLSIPESGLAVSACPELVPDPALGGIE